MPVHITIPFAASFAFCCVLAAPTVPPAAGQSARQTAEVQAKLQDPEFIALRRERWLKTIRLPGTVQAARAEGVSEGDMKQVLNAARRRGLHAAEMADIASAQRDAIRAHGAVDRSGAFVQSKLDEGLRGRELAAAIREEHVRRGRGASATQNPGNPTDAERAARAARVRQYEQAKARDLEQARRERQRTPSRVDEAGGTTKSREPAATPSRPQTRPQTRPQSRPQSRPQTRPSTPTKGSPPSRQR